VNAAAVVLLIGAAVTAAADWWAVASERQAVEYVAKPLTLVLLLAMAIALDPAVSARRGWFVAGLVFSLVGDVLLMLPRDLFVGGLGSFLAGHLCYIVGLTRHGGGAESLAVAGAAVIVVGIVPARRILPAAHRADRALLGPVVAYMLVISAMVACAAASGRVLAGVGAALFYVSDASIAWDRFVRKWSWARIWIMMTYHLGQACLVVSLVR
jgi:uncharacterized membrane protein YhhN